MGGTLSHITSIEVDELAMASTFTGGLDGAINSYTILIKITLKIIYFIYYIMCTINTIANLVPYSGEMKFIQYFMAADQSACYSIFSQLAVKKVE